MASWASADNASSKINLLMVCLEIGKQGLHTAQSFGRRFELPTPVLNGYVEQKSELPSFGQLGCQGFVVLGPHGEFAMQRTIPCYLEAEQKAFHAVEKLVFSLWGISLEPQVASRSPQESEHPFILSSVGVPEMDAEHEAIQTAVAELRRNKGVDSMARLLLLWNQHSQHEEELFQKFDFGRHRSDGASAATGPHCEHHRHISRMMEEFINGKTSSHCQVDLVAREIERHAALYDAAYAGKLGADSCVTTS
eukprot:TRINITY_DN51040_c0_g1_i1.p1 TRINITY_DN51040_c0_g1~~TRINITY_DN51040_c0_g1_i1.p1  ORF type:complete len:251 (+),score=40.56 TRINITY_DN51040_c0_g1_i1:249-1001(+)